MLYQIAFSTEKLQDWDIVDDFEADNDEEATAYAELNYPGEEWYILQNGQNIYG